MPTSSPPRVLSLIASATEIVCALGFRDQLVGRSHECDYPPDIGSLPQVTAPRFDISRSSREIDEQVRDLVGAADPLHALGVYEVSTDALRELAPTHIVTQAQCEVCAVSLRDVEAAVARVAGCEAQIVSLQPNALSDVWDDFARVGEALGAERRATQLVDELKARMELASLAARDSPARPTVAAIEWIDPLMAVGNWMPELIEMAGGRCLFGTAGKHSPGIAWEDVRTADPDVILLAPCGFGIERTLEDVPILEAQPGWESLRAVREGRVYAADGNQYFNRPGPRLAETLEILAEILHPDRFDRRYQGSGWQPLAASA